MIGQLSADAAVQRNRPLSGCAAASRRESCPAAGHAGPATRRSSRWRGRCDPMCARNR